MVTDRPRCPDLPTGGRCRVCDTKRTAGPGCRPAILRL